MPIPALLIAIIAAFMVTFFAAPRVIQFLRRKKFGQQIREDGPERHFCKAGTPTMGGVVIIAGLIVGVAVSWLFIPSSMTSVFLLALTVALAAIGSIDDWGKIRKGRSLGLRAREKLILQFLTAGLFVFGLVVGLHHGTAIGIPGIGKVDLHWAYWPLAILFISGMSNAVNLTDGLDGLAAGTSAAAAFALAALAWFTGNYSVAIFLACLGAVCLAFLRYNRHPARIFMGDTGSLAIGAALAGSALVIKQEISLLVIGLIFIIEVCSVIIQVISFKTTGKRVFRMSPFHHHLELGGWSEPKIVTRAWFLGALLAVVVTCISRFWKF